MRLRGYLPATALAALLSIVSACGPQAVAPNVEPKDADESTMPGTWTSLAKMPNARNYMSATALNGVVYVAGGNSGPLGQTPPTEILAYVPASDTWRTAGHLGQGVRSPGMAAVGKRIYVVGGFRDNPFAATTLLQIFDVDSGVVIAGPPMPTRRGALAVAVLDGRIHAIGGMTDDQDDVMGSWVNAHEVFDPLSGTWSRRAPLPMLGDLHGAVVVDGKIYVAAGSLDGGIHVYDRRTDTWLRGATASSHRRWFKRAMAAHGGKIYLFGGGRLPSTCCSGPEPQRTVDLFDPTSATWEQLAPMPTARMGQAASVIGDAIYVIGGSPTGPYTGFSALNERFTAR